VPNAISDAPQLKPAFWVELPCEAVRTLIELTEPKLAGVVATTEHSAIACPDTPRLALANTL
jgi:hypothetical protein